MLINRRVWNKKSDKTYGVIYNLGIVANRADFGESPQWLWMRFSVGTLAISRLHRPDR
jgi:hypothetical protein